LPHALEAEKASFPTGGLRIARRENLEEKETTVRTKQAGMTLCGTKPRVWYFF
jgi:hypothetical protein